MARRLRLEARSRYALEVPVRLLGISSAEPLSLVRLEYKKINVDRNLTITSRLRTVAPQGRHAFVELRVGDRCQVGLGAARNALGVPQDAQVIVSVGSLIPRKGYQFLIPAVAAISTEFSNLMLYVVGDGRFRQELQDLIARHGLQDRVFLVGNKPNEELKSWYSAANVSCLASSREGWPNVLLESMACGTPVVATRVWGAPEVISSTDLGILVEQNTNALASGLRLALNKKWDRQTLIGHASARTWNVVAQEVQDYFISRLQEYRFKQDGKELSA